MVRPNWSDLPRLRSIAQHFARCAGPMPVHATAPTAPAGRRVTQWVTSRPGVTGVEKGRSSRLRCRLRRSERLGSAGCRLNLSLRQNLGEGGHQPAPFRVAGTFPDQAQQFIIGQTTLLEIPGLQLASLGRPRASIRAMTGGTVVFEDLVFIRRARRHGKRQE